MRRIAPITPISAGSAAVRSQSSAAAPRRSTSRGCCSRQGAKVHLVIRGPSLNIHGRRKVPQPWLEAVRLPMSTIGPGWPHLACTELPWLFRYLPEDLRIRIVKRGIPPAAGWFMREHVVGKVDVLLRHRLRARRGEGPARAASSRERRRRRSGRCRSITSLRRPATKATWRASPSSTSRLLERIRTLDTMPVLAANFQSSVPGLYFVGAISAYSFGPVVRFIAGAGFTAHRIAGHLARAYASRRQPAHAPGMSAIK